ncbi:MAG: transglutaminase-like domain-containing protein [Candidatus Bathyarchaeota archaeon]|nr:transglutaminase-like domain-containing protein [Candidatus Bathyarchaeota archaeon]
MKRMVPVVFTLFLLLSTLTLTGFVVVKGEAEEAGFIVKMSVTYHNNGTEEWVFTNEDRAIGLFMNNTWQTVQLINHSYPLENTTFDEDGNPMAVLQFPESKLNLGENISYTVTYHALSKSRLLSDVREENSGTLDDIPEELKESYCGESDTWLVNDSELKDLAPSIAKGETKVLTIVKTFITWFRANVTYETQDTPRYPNETYAEREGDCDDQAILFITLCRILGIPSFLQIGCIHMPTISPTQDVYWEGHLTTSLKHIGWHGWAMVYIPPWGWLPVDFTYVIGGLADPLNAIKKAAVTSQKTLQYMNISQMDYIASSRKYRDFLKNNDFYVYTQDEMMEASPTNHGNDNLEKLFPWVPIIAIVVIAVTVAGIFVYVWKREKSKEIEFNPSLTFWSLAINSIVYVPFF